jgi:WhiB family transcriptional regulator, redox-sensing transcriptional regulator
MTAAKRVRIRRGIRSRKTGLDPPKAADPNRVRGLSYVPASATSASETDEQDEAREGMDMYWPGTTAVASGTAGLEAESVPGVRDPRRGQTAPVAVPRQAASPGESRVMVQVARTRPVLPCTEDPDLFFAESPQDVEAAKAMCRGCAARIACLTGALERQEPWGVWGGELVLRGEVVPRKRPRGRPRKTDVAA